MSALLFFGACALAGVLAPWARYEWQWRRVRRQVVERERRQGVQMQHRRP